MSGAEPEAESEAESEAGSEAEPGAEPGAESGSVPLTEAQPPRVAATLATLCHSPPPAAGNRGGYDGSPPQPTSPSLRLRARRAR